MESDRIMAWVLAFLAALGFGAMARRAGRKWLLWAIGGGVFSLVIATFVLGVARASFIPLSEETSSLFRIKSVAAAAALIITLGWFLTRNLHGQHRSIWEALRKRFSKKR